MKSACGKSHVTNAPGLTFLDEVLDLGVVLLPVLVKSFDARDAGSDGSEAVRLRRERVLKHGE